MTTVTSLTADRMLAIEAASVVDGDVVGDNLILTKHDGSQINAGSVRGPQGSPGPVGQDLPILTSVPVLDVGLNGQIRAGRQLSPADFGAMGLSAPIGLWNLSDLSDVSGNGRNLLNKGAVTFDGIGINGQAATAARFLGSTAQALYISDTGAADPFRIKTGSVGCWSRNAKTMTTQNLLGKWGTLASWVLQIVNNVGWITANDGVNSAPVGGVSNICDDRWHFVVATFDGTYANLYIDSILENKAAFTILNNIAAPFNIGANGADASNAAGGPNFGRIDEAFVTADILSEDQIRNLYCAKISHTLAAVPSRVSLNVHRRRKGAAFVVADFPAQPLRLHNFSGGSLGDEGSNGVVLINGGAISIAGVDGSNGNAFSFSGSPALVSTDTGLPGGLATRSYGCWVKTADKSSPTHVIMSWAAVSTQMIYIAGGSISNVGGADFMVGQIIADGLWHFVVVVEDNAEFDGIKRKFYVDSNLVAISTVFQAITLGGANRFRIGSNSDGSNPFNGVIDGVFVCDYALTSERISQLYAKSLLSLASSPKNVGDHVEAMNANNLLVTFDTLDSQHTIDLMVAP